MRCLILFLIVVYSVHCKKTYAPIDKHANVAFINMEGGGNTRPTSGNVKPASNPAPPAPSPVNPTPITPKPVAITVKPVAITVKPVITTIKPIVPTQKPVQPSPAKPIDPYPVNQKTTPLPGSVKDLVNYYNSKGESSVVRPYSYSQAVKQG